MAKKAQPAERQEIVDEDTGEVMAAPGRQLAPLQGGFGAVDPSRFKAVKYVSIPMLEVPEGISFIAQFVDKARVLEPLEGQKPKYQSPHYASTIKAPNGEVRLITWTTVLKNEIDGNYPNDAYVGKWFQLTKLPKKRDKNYSGYAITEVEIS